jgi:hypothetical protein
MVALGLACGSERLYDCCTASLAIGLQRQPSSAPLALETFIFAAHRLFGWRETIDGPSNTLQILMGDDRHRRLGATV